MPNPPVSRALSRQRAHRRTASGSADIVRGAHELRWSGSARRRERVTDSRKSSAAARPAARPQLSWRASAPDYGTFLNKTRNYRAQNSARAHIIELQRHLPIVRVRQRPPTRDIGFSVGSTQRGGRGQPAEPIQDGVRALEAPRPLRVTKIVACAVDARGSKATLAMTQPHRNAPNTLETGGASDRCRWSGAPRI